MFPALFVPLLCSVSVSSAFNTTAQVVGSTMANAAQSDLSQFDLDDGVTTDFEIGYYSVLAAGCVLLCCAFMCISVVCFVRRQNVDHNKAEEAANEKMDSDRQIYGQDCDRQSSSIEMPTGNDGNVSQSMSGGKPEMAVVETDGIASMSMQLPHIVDSGLPQSTLPHSVQSSAALSPLFELPLHVHAHVMSQLATQQQPVIVDAHTAAAAGSVVTIDSSEPNLDSRQQYMLSRLPRSLVDLESQRHQQQQQQQQQVFALPMPVNHGHDIPRTHSSSQLHSLTMLRPSMRHKRLTTAPAPRLPVIDAQATVLPSIGDHMQFKHSLGLCVPPIRYEQSDSTMTSATSTSLTSATATVSQSQSHSHSPSSSESSDSDCDCHCDAANADRGSSSEHDKETERGLHSAVHCCCSECQSLACKKQTKAHGDDDDQSDDDETCCCSHCGAPGKGARHSSGSMSSSSSTTGAASSSCSSSS